MNNFGPPLYIIIPFSIVFVLILLLAIYGMCHNIRMQRKIMQNGGMMVTSTYNGGVGMGVQHQQTFMVAPPQATNVTVQPTLQVSPARATDVMPGTGQYGAMEQHHNQHVVDMGAPPPYSGYPPHSGQVYHHQPASSAHSNFHPGPERQDQSYIEKGFRSGDVGSPTRY